MNDREKDVIAIARDEYKFRMEVLKKLTSLEANYESMCRDLDHNTESHKTIFEKLDSQQDKIEQHGNAIARIEGKAGAWGALMGVITGILVSVGVKNCG